MMRASLLTILSAAAISAALVRAPVAPVGSARVSRVSTPRAFFGMGGQTEKKSSAQSTADALTDCLNEAPTPAEADECVVSALGPAA